MMHITNQISQYFGKFAKKVSTIKNYKFKLCKTNEAKYGWI